MQEIAKILKQLNNNIIVDIKNEVLMINMGDFSIEVQEIIDDEFNIAVTDNRNSNSISDVIKLDTTNDKTKVTDLIHYIKNITHQLQDEYELDNSVANEDDNSKSNETEAILRGLIADEQDASANYLAAAAKFQEQGLTDIAGLMEDLSNEEIIHVGELEKALETLGLDSPDLVSDGEKEAEDKLEK